MLRIQVQAVIYGNEIEALKRTVMAMANAVRVFRDIDHNECQVSFVYGDASPKRILSEDEVEAIKSQTAEYLDFQYRFFGMNTGFGKGQNMLAENSKAEYLLIMNPDIKVPPHYFREMMKPFSDVQVCMVESRQAPIEHSKSYDVKSMETSWASGACIIIRRNVFEELKGFDDETFFMYCEDVDLSWRVRLAGYKIVYQSQMPVYHAKSLSSEGKWKPTAAEVYYSAESSLMMAHKWSNPQRVEKLLKAYQNGSEAERKVAESFEMRRKTGKLPTPIDPEHKVARFLGDYYSEHRFYLC